MSNETGMDSGTYLVAMVCTNCGCERVMPFKKGQSVPRKEVCPNCACVAMVSKVSDSSDLAKCIDVFFNGRPA
jgi:hypothetical protein